MSIAIVADSTLDVRDEFLDKVNFVPLKVIIGNEVYKDRELSVEEIFEIAERKEVFAKTSQPSPDDFKEVYEKLLKEHDNIISIHLSEKLSGTIQSARMAARDLKAEDRIFIFDIKAPSIIADPYVEKILELINETPMAIIKALEKLRDGIQYLLTVDKLEYLKNSGRLSGMQALIGSVLKLKPVIEVIDGELHLRKIIRGRRRVVSYFKKAMEEMGKRFVVGSIMAEDIAEELHEHAKKIGKPSVIVKARSAVLAAHLGPGSFGVVFIDE